MCFSYVVPIPDPRLRQRSEFGRENTPRLARYRPVYALVESVQQNQDPLPRDRCRLIRAGDPSPAPEVAARPSRRSPVDGPYNPQRVHQLAAQSHLRRTRPGDHGGTESGELGSAAIDQDLRPPPRRHPVGHGPGRDTGGARQDAGVRSGVRRALPGASAFKNGEVKPSSRLSSAAADVASVHATHQCLRFYAHMV